MSQSGTFGNGGSGSSSVLTLTGNSGGAVGPNVSGNINIIGAGGVTVVGNAGLNSLTISVAGSGIIWSTVTSNTAMVSSNGYVTNSASQLMMALPVTAAVGDTFSISGLGSGGWIVTQNSGQNIIAGTQLTTTGAAGSLASTNRYDDITLVCIVANTTFKLRNTGTFTVT